MTKSDLTPNTEAVTFQTIVFNCLKRLRFILDHLKYCDISYRMIARKIVYVILLITSISCQEAKEQYLFVPLSSDESGITFQNNLTQTDSLNIIQYLYYYNGGGVAAGDINGDGLSDLFFSSNQGKSKLYLNQTVQEKVRFVDITDAAGLGEIDGWSTGANMTDVNGDGLMDIYVCQANYKSINGINKLYINKGNQSGQPVFEELSKDYGLNYKGLSTQSAFFDYDRDGDLDMYLLNHSVHAPENYTKSTVREERDKEGDKLYRNDGDKFIDVTESAGIYSSKIGFGLGLGVSDLNDDGYPDIYIGNDFHENDYLYLNNQDGTFREVIRESMGHTSQFSMGLDIADINNDGSVDILTMDMMPEDEQVRKSSVPNDNYEIYLFKHAFGYHHQVPRNNMQIHVGIDEDDIPVYSEVGAMLDIEDTDWSWSGLLADYDNDGNKDLYVTNGILKRPNDLDYLNYLSSPLIQQDASDQEMIRQMPDGLVTNYLFLSREELRFEQTSDRIMAQEAGSSTGAAYADLDNDGDLDIITNNVNAPASILINQTGGDRSLRLRLSGPEKNKFGIGAKVRAHVEEEIMYYEHYPVRGFMSCSSGDPVIGIGTRDNIDSLDITWSDGTSQRLYDVSIDDTLSVSHEAASLRGDNAAQSSRKWFSKIDSILEYRHIENDYVDTNAEKLIPWLLSTQGPAVAIGDVNQDSREDIYFGGARGQPAVLMLQLEQGKFVNSEQGFLSKDAHFEDVDAIFFDADQDGDQDLYVVSGGNEQLKDSPFLLDRLYMNDGTGQYERSLRALPLITENGSTVAAADFDADGDQDLVIGSIVLSGNYGFSKGANLLMNDGLGKYTDVTGQLASSLKDVGMITDIEWMDIDNDQDLDIVLVGEWMSVTVMENKGGRFQKRILDESLGLWRTIEISDLDDDGDLDIVVGNFGANSFLSHEGAGLVVGDFDGNATMDPLLYHMKQGAKHPIAGKDLLTEQMNFFKNLHKDYTSFAQASFDEMFAPVINKKLKDLQLEELNSCWFENNGNGNFEKHHLPREAQVAPVFSIMSDDYNKDGNVDLLIGGNFEEISPYIGRIDAGHGLLLAGNGEGLFKPITGDESGVVIKGQIRTFSSIRISGQNNVIVARNDDFPVLLRVAY